MRSTTKVFEDHLARRLVGDVAGDIKTNYASDALLMTGTDIYIGHEGVQKSYEELNNYLEGAIFEYSHTLVRDNYAFLEWTAKSKARTVHDGADFFCHIKRQDNHAVDTLHRNK